MRVVRIQDGGDCNANCLGHVNTAHILGMKVEKPKFDHSRPTPKVLKQQTGDNHDTANHDESMLHLLSLSCKVWAGTMRKKYNV